MKRAIGTLLILMVFVMSTPVKAQMVVSDPTNFAQNAMTAAGQIEQVRQQIQEIQNQIQQIALMKQNLERLTSGDWAMIQESFRRLESLYEQANQISMTWGSVASEYDQVYQSYDPNQHGPGDYEAFRERWQAQTNQAIRSAMVSHGVVGEFERRAASLDRLLGASDSAQGTLAALQAGNQMAAILSRQMMELSEVIAADSRARLSYLREEQARREAGEARARDRMMRDYGGNRPDVQISDSLPRLR